MSHTTEIEILRKKASNAMRRCARAPKPKPKKEKPRDRAKEVRTARKSLPDMIDQFRYGHDSCRLLEILAEDMKESDPRKLIPLADILGMDAFGMQAKLFKNGSVSELLALCTAAGLRIYFVEDGTASANSCSTHGGGIFCHIGLW